jgi:hypothetical protein
VIEQDGEVTEACRRDGMLGAERLFAGRRARAVASGRRPTLGVAFKAPFEISKREVIVSQELF